MLRLAEDRRGKPTLARRLADDLREQILNGDLEPGKKLNLVQMKDAYDVSSTSLREAVTRLVSDGLVVAEEQRAYHVTPVSQANLAEVTQLLIQLEALALRASIENGGLDWETEVMSALYRLNRTERRSNDSASLEAWETEHRKFHVSLINRSGMPMLMQFLTVLMNLKDRYRRLHLKNAMIVRDVDEEHLAIADAAVSKRDADLACALLKQHTELTGDALRDLLADALPPGNDR